MKVIVTGSTGLIGSEAVQEFCEQGHRVVGIDNNMRQLFFGADGNTDWMRSRLTEKYRHYRHLSVDVQNFSELQDVFRNESPDVVIHCAAQPSHDLAARIPHLDFAVNATGTLNVLECLRTLCPEAVMIHMSTNKVYGDAPNRLELVESEMRFDFVGPAYSDGIDETFSIDQSLHSLFGCSKLAADVLAQEYGRNFGLKIGVFRGGCLTGPSHSGVALHGFLSYIVKCAVSRKKYTIHGYKGKQVRDQIHSRDVVRAFIEFIANPRCGEVYNLGGGKPNSASILEVISIIEDATGNYLDYEISDENRVGDHICYYTNLRKFQEHFNSWNISVNLQMIIEEMVDAASRSQSEMKK